MTDTAAPDKVTADVFQTAMDHMGLTPRPQQLKLVQMATDLLAGWTPPAEPLDDDQYDDLGPDVEQPDAPNKFAQAGTGTGKSYAILCSAVQARHSTGLPSMVICPTNRLIDQYVQKDAPRVSKATGAKIEYLKGRNRYICAESYGMDTKFGAKATEEFARLMETGRFEWAQHYGFDENFGCDGNCANKKTSCGVQWARERAASADVIVTNGHLLTFDQLVFDWSMGQARLLPEYGALFVDEGHELDPVVRSCLSDEIGPNASVYKIIDGLRQWVMEFVTERALSDREREAPSPGISKDPRLEAMAGQAAARVPKLERDIREAKAANDASLTKALKKDLKALTRFLDFAEDSDHRFVSTISVVPDQTYPGGLKPYLNRICVDASPTSAPILCAHPSLIVSGTLPATLPRRLGVTGSVEDVGTPFADAYGRSTLAISNKSPKVKDHFRDRLDQLVGAINDMASRPRSEGGGGTLVLCTSWADAETIGAYLARNLKGIPILAQSHDPADTAEMLYDFAHSTENSVLIGVRSFWTGVDVPGAACRQVIIWKLPYGVPSVETDAIAAIYGRQVYMDSMYEQLAQGVGRLVRQPDDYGRIIIMDSRARDIRFGGNTLTAHLDLFHRPHQFRGDSRLGGYRPSGAN